MSSDTDCQTVNTEVQFHFDLKCLIIFLMSYKEGWYNGGGIFIGYTSKAPHHFTIIIQAWAVPGFSIGEGRVLRRRGMIPKFGPICFKILAPPLEPPLSALSVLL